MQLNGGKEVAAMQEMPVSQLRDRYAEVFGETTNARNKQWMVKKIIWRLKSMAEGDLSERARARAMEIASDADIRRRPPKAPTPNQAAPKSAPIRVSQVRAQAGGLSGRLCEPSRPRLTTAGAQPSWVVSPLVVSGPGVPLSGPSPSPKPTPRSGCNSGNSRVA